MAATVNKTFIYIASQSDFDDNEIAIFILFILFQMTIIIIIVLVALSTIVFDHTIALVPIRTYL